MDTNRDSVFLAPLVDGIDLLPASPGLYCIVNRVNGRRYVGQASTNIYKRCLQHRSELLKGLAANMLLRRDAAIHGAGAFFFFALRLDAIAGSEKRSQLNRMEIWFAVQLCTHDEHRGYNLEVGHHRTTGARFRDRERKLMRPNSGKYELLPGVDIYDPIDSVLLASWVPGS